MNLKGKCHVAGPGKDGLDGVEEDLSELGVENWKVLVQDWRPKLLESSYAKRKIRRIKYSLDRQTLVFRNVKTIH